MTQTNTPYYHLEPSVILDAIESVGFRCSGSLLALNSYENRVYQVGIEDDNPIIAKFYRPHRWTNAAILEEHQFGFELLQREIPVVAPLCNEHGVSLHEFQTFRFALFPRRGGRALEYDNHEQLEWMGRFIGRLHAVGAHKPFSHRLQLNVENYGYQPYQYLIANQFIPAEIQSRYQHTVEALLDRIQQCFQEGFTSIRLHGDCHIGNILWSDTGPHIVDLDDCLMGPAVQDIWMLLTGSNEHETAIQLESILKGYTEFHDFNYRELSLIEALRTLRMIHYSGWLAKRWEDPAFPNNFPWFNTIRYWQDQLIQLTEQLDLFEKHTEF